MLPASTTYALQYLTCYISASIHMTLSPCSSWIKCRAVFHMNVRPYPNHTPKMVNKFKNTVRDQRNQLELLLYFLKALLIIPQSLAVRHESGGSITRHGGDVDIEPQCVQTRRRRKHLARCLFWACLKRGAHQHLCRTSAA